jgi:diguanylate cyclase (GGDEF)-like protein
MSTELSKEKLQALAYTDELTRLHNLRYMREYLPQYLDTAKETNQSAALFVCDLDDFKLINDNHGHLVGDKALIHFTKIIEDKTKDKGMAMRYAGDEFVLLMPKMEKPDAKIFALEIQNKVRTLPLKYKDITISLGCSIGISLFPEDGISWKALFEKADEALYMAKGMGKGEVVVTPESGKFITPTKLNSVLQAPYIVGRNDLIEFLEKHLCGEGDPKVFPVILGEEGSGKTRLMKFADKIAGKNLSFTLYAKGYPFWQNEMYGAVFTALGNLFEQNPSISDEVFSKLEEDYRIILKPYLPQWFSKEIDTSKEVESTESIALFEALTQTMFILREMGDGAVLLDDVDQIDPPSLQFFDSQFSQEEGADLHFVSSMFSPILTTSEEKLLLLSESMPELSASGKVTTFPLDTLQADHIQQLVAKLFDNKTMPEESAEILLKNSAGNPLFILESLSFLLQNGTISRKKGEWHLSDLKPEDIPTGLKAMIKERLLWMSKEAVKVLKLASILGEKINPHLLAGISKLKYQQVMNALSDAQRNLIIEETPNPEEFAFSHRMSRAVLYSLMDEKERSENHKLAAKLEQEYLTGSRERIVGKLAYHFHNAGELEKASEMITDLKSQMEALFISKGTRKMLQKRILTTSIGKESPLDEDDLIRAVTIARAFRSTMQNLRLYPKENENVTNALSQFMDNLKPFLTEKTEILSISLTPEGTLFNGQPLPPKAEDKRLSQDLYDVLNSFALRGLVFLSGITSNEVIQFLELFKRPPEEVIDKWDVLLDQLKISHILPDRKVFVAVGERKILLDEQEIEEQVSGAEIHVAPPTSETGAVQLGEDQIDRLKDILDQFIKEKQEFIRALESNEFNQQDLLAIVELLKKPDIENLAKSIEVSEYAPPPPSEAEKPLPEEEPLPEEATTEIAEDPELVKAVERDISLAFEELFSRESRDQSTQLAWLVKQDPEKLADAAFNTINSELPFKFRQLAAEVIQKAGKEATEAFLRKLHPGMAAISLNKVIKVSHVFLDNPELVRVLKDIALKGSPDVLPAVTEVLKEIQDKDVDSFLLEMYPRATGKAQRDIISLFSDRGITEAASLLLKIISPRKYWEPEPEHALQEHVCRTLGVLRSKDAEGALIDAAQKPQLTTLLKPKPVAVRAAATWALTRMERTPRVNNALLKLKRDSSPLVRKAAELSDIIVE